LTKNGKVVKGTEIITKGNDNFGKGSGIMIKRKPISAEYRKYLQSQRWKDLRTLALFRAHNKCQECEATEMLCIHHLKYTWKRQDEPVTDVKVLCLVCHGKAHQRKLQKRNQVKRVVIYTNGDIVHMVNIWPFFAKMRKEDRRRPWGTWLIKRILTPFVFQKRFGSDPASI